jgi:hypothetical protein
VESSFGWAGGATAGAVATGDSKTASLAKVDHRPFPLPQQADVRDGVTQIYIVTTILYLGSDVLRERRGSDIFFLRS